MCEADWADTTTGHLMCECPVSTATSLTPSPTQGDTPRLSRPSETERTEEKRRETCEHHTDGYEMILDPKIKLFYWILPDNI